MNFEIIQGDRYWHDSNNQYHREDGPAIEYGDGDQYWYHHGQLRRIKRADGMEQYWLDNQLHREDGPALIYEGQEEWWYQGHQLPCSTQQEFEELMQLKLFW